MCQLSMFGSSEDDEELKRIDELREIIRENSRLYYEEDTNVLSDFEYDKLNVELRNLEAKHPEYKKEESLANKIGGKKKEIFEDVVHEVPMQSLQDVFSFEDVLSFTDKIREEYGKDIEFCVETKIDGLSASLEYENGKLKRGSTRGDGLVGEDVTENLKCIESVPLALNTNDTIEFRGEVYLPRKEFNRLNEELEIAGKKLLANPRNAASGTLRQLDTNLVKHRNLDIFIFNMQKCETREFTKHSETLEYARENGLHAIELSFVCKTDEEIIDAINTIGEKRDSLAYDIDGAVVKINDLNLRQTLGTTVKVPKWAVAYKYPPEQKETIVEKIEFQVGRTGKVTPLAYLTPVKVAGSTISSVTLHNFDYLKSKDVRVGDKCIIQKAGDVIPELVKVLDKKRNGTEKEVELPTVCPICGEMLEKDENIVDVRCTNSECPALIYRSIIHFASRDCMDINGMGEAAIEKLIEAGKIQDISDIYYLKYEDIYNLENYKEKSALNLINAIEKSKSNSLDKLIFGLGIRNVGKKAAKTLMVSFEDIYKLSDATYEELLALEDFGDIMAKSVYDFFKKEKTKEIIEKLEKANVNLQGEKIQLKSTKLENMTICITGSFDNFSREEITKMIEENGGKASSSVSKKTTYLIAGENAGSKLDKATSLGVEIIDIEKFIGMLN